MPGTAPYPPRDEHEEFANTLTHGAGVVLSVAGGVALLSSCTHWTVAVACGLYALTLVATYAASALSHGVRRPDWKHLLSVWDQGVIFLLIIGTYTPFLVAYLPSAWTMPVLVLLPPPRVRPAARSAWRVPSRALSPACLSGLPVRRLWRCVGAGPRHASRGRVGGAGGPALEPGARFRRHPALRERGKPRHAKACARTRAHLAVRSVAPRVLWLGWWPRAQRAGRQRQLRRARAPSVSSTGSRGGDRLGLRRDP